METRCCEVHRFALSARVRPAAVDSGFLLQIWPLRALEGTLDEGSSNLINENKLAKAGARPIESEAPLD